MMINRRRFAADLSMSLVALGIGKASPLSFAAKRPQVAVTLDDFVVFDTPLLSKTARNEALLAALRKHKLQAAMFVAGRYVDKESNMDLVRRWDAEGHMIANHTYSHSHYPDADFQKFTADILRNEALLKPLPRFRKFLRFPYLKEGDTAQQRDRIRAFMRQHGYRNGHVTIDASDWYVDERLRQRLKENERADIKPYRDFYLSHIWERAAYYEDLSQKVLGRSVKHTLLLHHNLLNGLFLGDVLQMFRDKGWQLLNAEEAYTDPVFSRSPNIAPAGESLVWALAKETGKFEKSLRYPAEDGTYEKPKMDALGL
ncbi:MAG TPA: polysaccharide deacetylase family protein [Pyrinomonadaceae bacterium]|jgi:peptidoglycan/xylan/chitin deacetylase (PgdA/CDA1 family)|nr:polysaccharide deacetylase family protein [Pyrinomonadaceae bacterium]